MSGDAYRKLDNFFAGFKKVSLKKGGTIYRAEDKIHSVYYLKAGYVKLYSLSKNAQELIFIIYKPGDLFPLIPTINEVPSAYYAETMTQAEVYQAPLNQFRSFLYQNGDIVFELMSHILTRFGGVLTRMEYAIFGIAKNKVAGIILICSERFGAKNEEGILIQVPLTHQDIANLLGVARETVSIEMKKLQNSGVIDYRNHGKHLIVRDTEKLKEQSSLTA